MLTLEKPWLKRVKQMRNAFISYVLIKSNSLHNFYLPVTIFIGEMYFEEVVYEFIQCESINNIGHCHVKKISDTWRKNDKLLIIS